MLVSWSRRATTKSDVEGDDGLSTFIHIHCLTELGVEQALLCRQHFEIAGLAVVHEFVGTEVCLVKRVTTDGGDVEDGEDSLTPDPSPQGEGSENQGGGSTGGDNNGGGTTPPGGGGGVDQN